MNGVPAIRVVRAHVSRQEEPIAADAGVHRDVLPAVGAGVRDGVAHHPGSDFEAPQDSARPRAHPAPPAPGGAPPPPRGAPAGPPPPPPPRGPPPGRGAAGAPGLTRIPVW